MAPGRTRPSEETIACEIREMRRKPEAYPRTFLSRFWRWHTNGCPGWKAPRVHLAAQKAG